MESALQTYNGNRQVRLGAGFTVAGASIGPRARFHGQESITLVGAFFQIRLAAGRGRLVSQRCNCPKKLQKGLRKRFKMGRLLPRFGPGDGRKPLPSVV